MDPHDLAAEVLSQEPPEPGDLGNRPNLAADSSEGPEEGPVNSGSFQPGSRMGDYRLVRLLGRGGTSEVWEALQVSLGRSVALKLLHTGRVGDRAVEFFTREARAGAKLSHPDIVSVHSSGVDDGVFWFAMELVPGGSTLADRIEEERAGRDLGEDRYAEVAELVARVAEAMQSAHDGGVIHRDLKPANILLRPGGVPAVGDFGLARLLGERSLSQTGDLSGTYHYMSPERVMAKRIGSDHRTDVFSLGAVLYELLSLQRPFEGDTTHQIVQKVVLEDPADPRTLRPDVPADLVVICAKAMEKMPAHRYPTMAEFAADLRRHLAHEPILAKPPTPIQRARKWLRRNPTGSAVVGVAAVALAVISALGVSVVRTRAELDSRSAELQAERARLVEALVALELEQEERTGPADGALASAVGLEQGNAVAEASAARTREERGTAEAAPLAMGPIESSSGPDHPEAELREFIDEVIEEREVEVAAVVQ